MLKEELAQAHRSFPEVPGREGRVENTAAEVQQGLAGDLFTITVQLLYILQYPAINIEFGNEAARS